MSGPAQQHRDLRRPAAAGDLLARARAVRRRRPRPPGHLLAEGVHPAHDAVPRPLRLLHLRPAAGPPRVARTSRPTRCSPSPRPAPRPAATRRSSPSARRPRTATPSPRELARRARLRLHRRLPRRHVPARARRDRPAPPRQRRRARRRPSSPRLRAVAPSQGMMVESLRDDLDCHRGAPDKVPARRLATLEAAGELGIPFTTGILVGIGEDVADRIAALEAIAAAPPPPRPRAGGDRPELPAEGRHRDARRAAVPARRLPPGHRPGPADPAARGPPAGAAQPVRRLRPRSSTPASTTGAASPPSPPTT